MTTEIAWCGARIAVDDRLESGKALVIRGDTIEALVEESDLPVGIDRRSLDGGVLAAGFIDTQVNGGGGILFNEQPDLEGLRVLAAAHRRFGTTGLMPTVISDDPGVVDKAMRTVERAIAEGIPGILGIHVEGPMLAPTRHGIHDPAYFRGADPDMIALVRSLRAGRTLVTIAPEVIGAEAIAELAEAGVIVSAGHTDATFEEMCAGFEAGVTGVTHLFNAMSAMTSRAPGAVGAALSNHSAWCGIIVDGAHVHPSVLSVALRCRPHDRFMLVTDAMSSIGTSAKEFLIQGRAIRVVGNRCVDAEGTLAGSNLTMADAVRNAVAWLGLSLPSALRLASASPAAFLGMGATRGRIAPGLKADLVWLDEGSNVRRTWIGGVEFEEGEP